VKLDLGSLAPALEGWILCVDECGEECAVCVKLPSWSRKLSERVRTYISLYLATKASMDYRIAGAMHVYMVKNRVSLNPAILLKALREAKVNLRIPKLIEENTSYAWESVLYKGIAYSQTLLDLEKPVIVKVEAPRNKREREKLRVLIEGKRVTVKGRTYHVGGLLRKISAKKIAPWIYMVPKKQVPKLIELVEGRAQILT